MTEISFLLTNSNPVVSIIVPNYNHEAFIKERLNSIFNQSFQDYEIILLDDASTDDSIKILSQYKNHPKVSHFILNEVNSGSPFKQWLKGIELAKGKYIWIAESDDFASYLFLEKVMVCFEDNYKPDIVFVGTTNVNEKNKGIVKYTRIERKHKTLLETDFNLDGREFLNYFLPDYCVIRNASSAVFKKSILSRSSKNVISFKTIGDFYFWINFCLENRKFSYRAEKLNFMRKHENTVRGNPQNLVYKKIEYSRIHKYILRKKWYNINVVKKILISYLKKLR